MALPHRVGGLVANARGEPLPGRTPSHASYNYTRISETSKVQVLTPIKQALLGHRSRREH